MKLLIDNLDGFGARDYTAFVDFGNRPKLTRKLNCAAKFRFGLLDSGASPVIGSRVTLTLTSGDNLFTGYVAESPALRYLGWADGGVVYSHEVLALSDVMLMDQKAPPPHPPFVDRKAGDAFRQLTEDTLPGWFDVGGVETGETVPYCSIDPTKKWTVTAAEIALAARCSFRDDNGKLFFTRLATDIYALTEGATSFSPSDLQLQSVNRLLNDLTIVGQLEPGAHVKDHFIGDGSTTRFYLSQKPFTRSNPLVLNSRTILDEPFATLVPTRWSLTDPQGVITVSNGQLQVAGGTGTDGQTILQFIEEIELGGATVLEHGDFVFSAPSDGVVGGLYSGTVSIADCLAGFRITPSGTSSQFQALIAGTATGTTVNTQAGHHYVLSTKLYPTEVYRRQQVFHSSAHPSGEGRGGAGIGCEVRVVLEVHDINPASPMMQIAPTTVLYDGLLTNPPGFCAYALVNAGNVHCSVGFTYFWLETDALVRSTPYQETTLTRRTGSLRDGAECYVTTAPALQFYPEYIPAKNEAIEVSYRGQGHAMARVIDSASVAAHQRGGDDGVRGSLRAIALPAPRTAADCETAALALLDDAGQGWAGEYEAWSQFLPDGAGDIFPGDGLAIDIPSRGASFLAIVREVEIEVIDIAGETSRYTMRFVDAGDPSLSFAFSTALVRRASMLTPVDASLVGNAYLADVTDAELTNVTSTTVTIDAGFAPMPGSGLEVRYTDAGWGIDNARNLVGRFSNRIFALTRYARSQDYFLRSYDGSTPPKYSRYSTALHVDYPL